MTSPAAHPGRLSINAASSRAFDVLARTSRDHSVRLLASPAANRTLAEYSAPRADMPALPLLRASSPRAVGRSAHPTRATQDQCFDTREVFPTRKTLSPEALDLEPRVGACA
jgi:hypothetical protein